MKEKKKQTFNQKKYSNKSRKPDKSFKARDERDLKDLKGKEIITGIFSQSKNYDFGFIDVPNQPKGYFVYPKNQNNALDQDEVKAYLKTFRGRQEAVIIEIVKRADRVFVGTLSLTKNFGFVVLDNKILKRDIYISSKSLSKCPLDLKDGMKVGVKVLNWSDKNPEGYITEILPKDDIVAAMILESGIKREFPSVVLNETIDLKFEDNPLRRDLSDILTYTIDGDDAKDLDDAISIFKNKNNYHLIVSIADVSEYVKPKSFLDKEALKRGNSTYLADRVIPMLPEKLSNDLCSLNPNTKKLTLSVEITLDENGNILKSNVFTSKINSNFRLTYKEVQDILDDKILKNHELKFGGVVDETLISNLKLAYELKQKVTKLKQKSGVLNFEFDETKVILDENKHPVEIIKYERFESHKIIEEFMILANQCVGEMFSNLPFLYRIHEVPDDEDIFKLKNILNIFGISFNLSKITPKTVADLLIEINKSPKSILLSRLLLRSLKKAIYSEENKGHFGLGLAFYSHFTSPIRRYSDLIIHRIIKQKLSKKLDKFEISNLQDLLPKVARIVSDTEIRSQKLEFAVRDLMIAKYYEDKIGQEFDGMISGTIPAGFFVVLDNSTEGFVNIEEYLKQNKLKGYEYVENMMKFEINKNKSFQVGDFVKIKIKEVDLTSRRLNFELV